MIFTSAFAVTPVVMGTVLLGSHAGKLTPFYNLQHLMQVCYTSSTWEKMEWRDFRQKSRLLLLGNLEMTLNYRQPWMDLFGMRWMESSRMGMMLG